MSHDFYITDVFTEQPYAGNQLGTLVDAADISAAEMQAIAREFNFAETTFVVGGDLANGFDVRIFTPLMELPFAGHPTLGTAFVIRNSLLKTEAPIITLNLGVGKIPVAFSEDGIGWMTQKSPVFGETISVEAIAEELGLEKMDIDSKFPVQFVSTGLQFLLVPVTSEAALKKAKCRGGFLSDGYFVFCTGGYNEHQSIQARMFGAALGVVEDPATGSANGCLASYLVEHSYLGNQQIDIAVGQGYEIGRPSQLYLRASKIDDVFDIKVGGRVRIVASGDWHGN